MTNRLADVLNKISAEFEGEILPDSDKYILINIGKVAESLGQSELKGRYDDVAAVVPLEIESGISAIINGKDLCAYAQLDSGIAVPAYVAEEAGLPSKQYQPKDIMYWNLT
ncbi:MAG: hypothetical protein U9R34_07240 [Nanoarchaeota archaeon]|nr:hypothetical protein [Nanoarchaeota archaeon]